MIMHCCIIGAVVITVATFETAKRRPQFFDNFGRNGRGYGGEHE